MIINDRDNYEKVKNSILKDTLQLKWRWNLKLVNLLLMPI